MPFMVMAVDSVCTLSGLARDKLLTSKEDGFAFEELDGCGDEDGA